MEHRVCPHVYHNVADIACNLCHKAGHTCICVKGHQACQTCVQTKQACRVSLFVS
jgi:hypothetical protein